MYLYAANTLQRSLVAVVLLTRRLRMDQAPMRRYWFLFRSDYNNIDWPILLLSREEEESKGEGCSMASPASTSSFHVCLLLALATIFFLVPKGASQSCGVLLDQSGGAAQGVAGLNASVVGFRIQLKTSYITLDNITITFNYTLTGASASPRTQLLFINKF
jgi:hypothetical protein